MANLIAMTAILLDMSCQGILYTGVYWINFAYGTYDVKKTLHLKGCSFFLCKKE